MLISGLNTVGGKDIPFATLALHMQMEILFIYGSPSGLITHYDNTVYLNQSDNKYFEQIQTMLWSRENQDFPKKLYKCVNWTTEQSFAMYLRIGWAIKTMARQMDIVLGNTTQDAESTVVIRRGERYTFENASRLVPVIIKDYDEPANHGPIYAIEEADDPENEDYHRDKGGIIYRITRS